MIEKTAKEVPCHCCGGAATEECAGFPVCHKCAIVHKEDLKKENGFEI